MGLPGAVDQVGGPDNPGFPKGMGGAPQELPITAWTPREKPSIFVAAAGVSGVIMTAVLAQLTSNMLREQLRSAETMPCRTRGHAASPAIVQA